MLRGMVSVHWQYSRVIERLIDLTVYLHSSGFRCDPSQGTPEGKSEIATIIKKTEDINYFHGNSATRSASHFENKIEVPS